MIVTSLIERAGLTQCPGPSEQGHDNPLERQSVGLTEHLEQRAFVIERQGYDFGVDSRALD
jgi:hypothetical protein